MEDVFQFLAVAHLVEKLLFSGMVACFAGLIAYFIFDYWY